MAGLEVGRIRRDHEIIANSNGRIKDAFKVKAFGLDATHVVLAATYTARENGGKVPFDVGVITIPHDETAEVQMGQFAIGREFNSGRTAVISGLRQLRRSLEE